MIKLLKRLLLVVPLFMAMATTSSWAAIYIKTTGLENGSVFSFGISAAGTFYVDCDRVGSGKYGTLAGPGVKGNQITRASATQTPETYTCTYIKGVESTNSIGISGTATAYYNAWAAPAAITFTGNTFVREVSGDFSSVFPQIGGSTNYVNQPSFESTFENCTNLAAVGNSPSAGVFSGYTAARGYMFKNMFKGCTSFLEADSTLFEFANDVSGKEALFYGTFQNSGIKTIPSGLFSSVISNPSSSMFYNTFYNCTALAAIPSGLFDFGGHDVSGANGTFYATFYNCTTLRSIPENLFARVTSPAQNLFRSTFNRCRGLTKLPNNLFPNITSGATNIFYYTFYECMGLTGYIPSTLFSGLIANGSPSVTMNNIFNGDPGLATTTTGCPSGTALYTTGYESQWSSHISCAPGFQVKTTNLSSGDTFQFKISAAGEFNVQCGVGGTLSGTGVSGDTITKSDTANNTYTCTYSSAGQKTISIFGAATGYNTATSIAAIGFNIDNNDNDTNVTKISSISGSLGHVFGSVANPSTGIGQPSFYWSFYKASNMTGSIPGDLFYGISGNPIQSMFNSTFFGCSGLTGSIPGNLFSGISGTPEHYMFDFTFNGCSGLSGTNIDDPNNSGMKYAIPPTLFSGISGTPAQYMFRATFQGCSGLTGSIPGALFSGISGTPAQYMFNGTFSGCSGLTGSIPGNLFSGVSGTPAQYMFNGTFNGCSGLSGTNIDDPNNSGMKYAIPPTLFSGISGTPAQYMFSSTFSSCSGLTGSIPGALFSGISGTPAQNMFNDTFYGCRGLTGSIPSALFAGISGTPAQNMFQTTFYGCRGLTGSIPSALFAGISGTPAQNMFQATFSGCIGLTGFGDKNYVPETFLANISTDTSVTNQVASMFTNTGLANPCPGGTTNVTRPQFNNAGKPWCSPNTIALNWYDNASTTMSVNSASQSCVYDETLTVPSAPSARTGFSFTGWEVRPTYDFTTIPNVNGLERWSKGLHSNSNCWYDTTTGSSTEVTCANDPNFTELATYQWKVRFPTGTLYGVVKCSNTSGELGESRSSDPSTASGKYGWCQATGWKPNGSATASGPATEMPLILRYIGDGASNIQTARCRRNGPQYCATYARENSAFRTALLTPVQ